MAYYNFTTIRILFVICMILAITSPTNANGRLCGSQLANALHLICGGNYNVIDKKSVNSDEYYDQAYVDDDYAYRFSMPPFLARLHVGSIIPKVRRTRQGVANECCKKPCNYAELLSYCQRPSSA